MAFQAPQFTKRARHVHPQQMPASQPDVQRPAWYDLAANAHGNQLQALAIPTREVKLRIAILGAWLANPVESRKLSRDEKIEMRVRLDAYRNELRRRGDLAKARAAAQRQKLH